MTDVWAKSLNGDGFRAQHDVDWCQNGRNDAENNRHYWKVWAFNKRTSASVKYSIKSVAEQPNSLLIKI